MTVAGQRVRIVVRETPNKPAKRCGFHEDAVARDEYEQLREFSPSVVEEIREEDDDVELNDELPEADEEENEEMRALTFDELARLNQDFIGWINVNNLIDYPVVRGRDNSRYINTTFTGGRNTAGAIFMDYRHANGFDEPVSILYGHYTRDGSMFSPLVQYLDSAFLQRNPNITITTRDGRKLSYRIFAATLTDAWDVAYTIGVSESERAAEVFPGAPENASSFLLMSTCTRSSDVDERILVFAAR